ncbi:MerR family transcriptional regulator [Gordonia sp. NPDC062954]|jgi:DNA-binding transcriptional MerR regulator|uniref:MerR family transcriptional regulator n=1 Tax=unclassified Gordonia (in: high G+C Gram-positive bacteria) TaxID=2657482 RepID=UPI000C40F8E7|nr:MerR family transcriptional regulator [Gordonia sp. (in: high G+C Gram-positive bacteria)]MAU84857.1 MerR family transcriptional regulator [Gordonia sp. (in: high G+C Gram-positive bacteria)]
MTGTEKPDTPAAADDLLQIGEVAHRTELSIKTIRHYDEVGLVVPSARSAGGFRLYTPGDIDRLLVIRRMKPAGFSLDDMRRLLDAEAVLDDPEASADDKAAAGAELAEFHQRAQESCRKLARQLAYAEELTEQLAARAGAHS